MQPVGEGALNQEPANQASLGSNLEGLFGQRELAEPLRASFSQ